MRFGSDAAVPPERCVKRFMLLMLLLGISLLGAILYRTDLGEVWERLQQLDTGRLVLVLAIYVVGTICPDRLVAAHPRSRPRERRVAAAALARVARGQCLRVHDTLRHPRRRAGQGDPAEAPIRACGRATR